MKDPAADYVLDKFRQAGIPVSTDREEFASVLRYVDGVNAALEMCGEFSCNGGLKPDVTSGNILSSLAKIKMPAGSDSCPIREALGLGAGKEFLCLSGRNGERHCLRVSDSSIMHGAKEGKPGVYVQISSPDSPYGKTVSEYFVSGGSGDRSAAGRIAAGISALERTGEFSCGCAGESVTPELLRKNLAEQMTLGGVRKALMTGVAVAAMASAAPKLSAHSRIVKSDGVTDTVTVEQSIDVTSLHNGFTAVTDRFNDSKHNITIIVDSSGNPTACYQADVFWAEHSSLLSSEEKGNTKNKVITVSFDTGYYNHNYIDSINILNRSLSSSGSNYNLDDSVADSCSRILNVWAGIEGSAAEKFACGSVTYGLALNGRIYLNPDIINSNAAVHEYTHLWDRYIRKTNPELWNKGMEIFSGTRLWQEVKSDSAYAAIADDDNLVLSECHARVCGLLAQSVLERIGREDGSAVRDGVVRWDRETENYIRTELSSEYSKFIRKDPSLPEGYMEKEIYGKNLEEFLSAPLKDLVSCKSIVSERAAGKRIPPHPWTVSSPDTSAYPER